MGYGWGGYANGKVPYDALVLVRGAWLEPTAAYWAEIMSLVFNARFGKHLRYSEGFRDYDRQVYLYNGWINRLPGFFNAAYPGGSIHGWALAIDVDLTGMTREQINWLHVNGPQFGFNWETTGRPTGEDWHLDFNLTPTFDFNPADFGQKVDEFMSELSDAEQRDFYNRVISIDRAVRGNDAEQSWEQDGVKLQPLVVQEGQGERWFLINTEAPLDSPLYRKKVEMGPGRLSLVKRYFQNDVINEAELNIVLNELASVKK